MRISTLFACLAIILLAAPTAFGQVASALVVEGESLDGAPLDHFVFSINNSAVNHVGGWSFTVNTVGTASTLSHAFGNAAGGVGSVILTEATYGDYQQNSWESFFGMADDGAIAYSPSCDNLDNGASGLDGVWKDGVFVAVEELLFPHDPAWWWSFGSRPGITADGTPYFVGGLTNVQGGGTILRGIFSGTDGSPNLLGGDDLGFPWPVTPTGIDFDLRFSENGSHWINVITLATGNTANDAFVLFNGSGITFAGPEIVREGNSTSGVTGSLPGEHWQNFDFLGVTEAGYIFFTGDTDVASNVDEFVLLNGEFVLREGDFIGGNQVSGAIEGGYMNADGDWAAVWDVDLEAGGGNVEALIVNGEIILLEGDEVDMDNDGVVEPTSILDNFTGITSLTLGDRDGEGVVRAYFTADVTVPGAPLRESGEWDGSLESAGLDFATNGDRSERAVIEGGFVIAVAPDATAVADTPALPAQLLGNYPNPFNPATKIAFSLAANGPVHIDVISPDGRLVATLLDGVRAAGSHEVEWLGLDDTGTPVSSGVYLARLRTAGHVETRSLVLLK